MVNTNFTNQMKFYLFIYVCRNVGLRSRSEIKYVSKVA
jgi:hypothetical protein